MTEPARKLGEAERDACMYCGESRGVRKGMCRRCRDDRDLFAGLAMAALVHDMRPADDVETAADDAYRMAEAMLRRRER